MFKKFVLSLLAVFMCLSGTGHRLFADDEPVEASGFSVDTQFVEMNLNETYQLTPKVSPENATGYTFEYSLMDNNGVVSVSESGLLSSNTKEGRENIQIVLKGSNNETIQSIDILVTVKDPTLKRYNVEHYVSSNGVLNLCSMNWDIAKGSSFNFVSTWSSQATKITVNGQEVSGSSYKVTGEEDGEVIEVVYFVPWKEDGHYTITGADNYVQGVDKKYDFSISEASYTGIYLDDEFAEIESDTWNLIDFYLPENVMKKLSVGSHELKVEYFDGRAIKTINVLSPESMEWNEPEYVWSDDNSQVTASIVCKTDSSIVLKETVDTTEEVITPSTCTVKGSAKYTASFENSLFTTQVKETELPLAAHSYELVSWDWTDGEEVVAVAHIKCTVCNELHDEKPEVEMYLDETSCTETGYLHYRAGLNLGDQYHEDTHSVEVDPLGHDYEVAWEWADDYSLATLKLTCKRDASHTVKSATEPNVNKVDPECGVAGYTEYVAHIELDGVAYEDTKKVEIPALKHQYEFQGIVWNEWNAIAKYECSTCHDTEDVECEINVIADIAPKCEVAGVKEAKATISAEKSLDGVEHTDTKHEDYDALVHEAGEVVVENKVEAKCLEDGSHDEVTYCVHCHKEMSRNTVVDKAPGHMAGEPVKENVVEATCEEDGSYDLVTYCKNCDAELSREHITVGALKHDWEFSYEWAEDLSECTAKRVCKHNPEHHTEETVKTSYSVAVPSTCKEKGTGVHVAIFTNTFFGVQIEEVELPLAEHTYLFDHMEWSEDEMNADAIFKCSVCGDEAKVKAEISSEIVKEATCEETGLLVRTALVSAEKSLDGAEHVDTKELVLGKLMHVWMLKEWQWGEDNTAKAVFECAENSETTLTVDAKVSSEEDEENITYTATVEVQGKAYTDTKKVAKPFEYEFLDAPIKEYVLKSNKDVEWHTNGKIEKLVAVKIDGKELVTDKDVVITEGSTIAKVSKNVLENLTEGKHQISFVYEDGELMAEFVVKAPETGKPAKDPNDEVPTGDPTNLVFWYSTLATSVAGAYVLLKKKNED